MGYSGSRNIQELKNGTRFIRVTANGLRENHPHDIRIMTEPPNYQTFYP